MADLRDYKNKDFSITVNSRMKGIELRFENTMTEEQIASIKDAGFKWSKRQQMWYAYQNEKTIAYAKSLESQYEDNLENNEIKQEKAEPSQVEQTVLLQDLIAELREEIRMQNEKIKELEEIIEEKNNEKEEILLEAENGEKMTIDEYNQWNEEQALQEEIDDLEVGNKFIEANIEEETEIILAEEELEICRKIIPPNQYAYTLGLTQGEEGDFYKQKLKDIAKIAKQITTDDGLINEDGTHNVGFHYFVGNSDFYISEIKSDGTAFGYTILNGDVEMAEWGYQNISEIINTSQWIEMDYHVPEGMTIERMLEEKYPEYYKQESVVEIKHQSSVVVPREKIFSIFNKYISNEEYATEKANKFIKGWENKDFNSLAEGLVFKKDTTAELRKLFNETEKVSLPEGNSNHLEVYTYLTKFADVETIPTEGKFNTWNDVIDYDIEVRTSLENKKNIFHFFQTHTSQTERTNYLKKEYSNRGGGVLPFNYVYTSDGIYLKALIDGKIKEKSYTWAEYTKFISDKISQGTYYTEPKIEKVTNKLIPSFNLLNEQYAIEFEPAEEGEIEVNSEADKWIVKFYDISKVIPGEIDKGRFIQSYYASSLLQNQNSTVGLNLGYGWSLDAETFNRAKEIIKDFVSLDMSEIFSSKQNINDEYSESLSEYSKELIKNNNSNKFSFILEKLSAAGIEVVTDKAEFDRILKSNEILQKMAKSLSELEDLKNNYNEIQNKISQETEDKNNLLKQESFVNNFNFEQFSKDIQNYEKLIPVNQEIKFSSTIGYSNFIKHDKFEQFDSVKLINENDIDDSNLYYKNISFYISKSKENSLLLGFSNNKDYENLYDFSSNNLIPGQTRFGHNEKIKVLETFKILCSQKDLVSILHDNLREKYQSMLVRQQDILVNLINENSEKKNIIQEKYQYIRNIEKIEARKKIDEWLYEAEEKAPDLLNKDLNFIKQYFQNDDERCCIGILPEESMELFSGISDYHLYADKSYVIDHYLNRHSDNRLFENIQNVLDTYSNIYFDTHQNSIAFVKKYGNLADSVFVKNNKGKIVLFASTYNLPEERLKNERYKKITLAQNKKQEFNMSLEGSTPLSQNPVGNTAVAISDVNDKINIPQNENKSSQLDDGSLFVTQMTTKQIQANIVVKSPNDVVPYLDEFAKSEVENFGVVMLDSSHKIKEIRTISVGTINRSLVHAREVFKEAVRNSAANILIFHNHPSGSLEPSNDDIETTKRLVEASTIMGIPILDHIIVSTNGYFSFKEYDLLNEKIQNYITQDGTTYGFAYNGKIYLNPDIVSSETAIHEYTHIWDNYTKVTNPELWNKGKEVFKNTYLWEEVKNDSNYQDIANDEDLILSECHARITGKIADQILDKIYHENGELTKNTVIDWDKEVFEYIAKEFSENEIDIKSLSEFVSQPMKDFMEGKELGFEIPELKRNEIATLLEIELNQSKITEKEIINRVEKGKNLVKSYFFEHWKDDKENGVFDLWATHDAMRYVGFNPEIQNYENGKYVDVYNQEEKKELEKINQTMENLLNEYSSELIERMNNNSNKFLFIFEKLQAAEIEVVFDKEEFDRILEREKLLQKMAESKSEKYLNTDDVKLLNDMGYIKDDFEQIQYAMLVSDIKLNGKKTSTKKTIEILGRKDFLSGIARSAFHGSSKRINGDNSVSFDSFILFERAFSGLSIEKRNQLNDAQQKAKEHVESLNEIVRQESYFSFDVEDEKKFINHIDDWQKDNTNPLKMIIVGKVPPVMKVLGISEKLIEIEQSTLDKMLRDEPIYPNDKQGHKLSLDDIYAIPSQLADPVMVFKSRTRDDSYVFFTEKKDLENRSILIPLAVDKKKGRLVIHEITSMYGRNNEVDFVKTNIDENNLIYEDRKRSCLWANEKVEELKKRSSNGERFTQIQFLGQRFTDNGTYIFSILTKERLVNFLNGINGKNTQNFITQDGTTYGFAHENKIYLNPDIVSSEAAIHEYTHIWDNYVQKNNPELWNKGKEVFKNTYLWEEVKNDPNYQDIANDEDLILSECHARITGKIADKILDKILTENGKLAKDNVIDWDKEVFEYISKEFSENEIDIKSLSEFVSQTMKDFMEGKSISKTNEKDLSQTSEPHTKKEIKNIREQCRGILQKSDEEITEEDKLILAQYEGGGGIDEDSRTSAQVLNEFYTPNNLIEKVWNLVDAYNPNAVTVLEPTAGIGKFANNRPNNQFTMHELDETSARINKILHPEANIIQGAYQKQFLDEHERILNEDYVQPKYDIVIGNPPYGEYSGKYKNIEGKHHQRYEEYFIEKGLDALKDENSILAYVVPSGFLNTAIDKQKEIISSKGHLIDAYRLPEKTFPTTEVGTDIIIMQNFDKVKKSLKYEKDISKGIAEGVALDELSNGNWFKQHPEKILGKVKTRTNQFGKLVDTVVHHEGLSIQDELNKIDDFVADIKKRNTYEKQQESNIEIIEEELEELEVIEEVKEETPQKNKITTKTKEENQEKRLAPVMTSEEFSKLYGRDFKAEELPIWKATDWEGNIDTSKLSFQEENLLHESSNYVEIEPGKFTHRVLFESGDIGSKIEDYKAKIKVIQFNNEDSAERKIALYEKNIAELEKISPNKITIERLHFGLNSTLAEEFMVEHISSEGEIVKLNLQESFILWAKGQTYAQFTDKTNYSWRGGIDFATANISQEDFPQSVSWYDIVEYIDKKPVKAERVTGTWHKEDYEIKADKAQARREAEEKRMARSETADKLFDKYLHEGLSEDLSKRVEAEYNRRFNSYVIPDYSKLPLFIDGMSKTKNGKKFKLYDQQIKGVSFLCNKGNGLLAYDVGVGKTAAGIVATVNQIQTGRSKRPVIVVPNAVYAKWYNDICELFPNIKVNDLYNLNKESTEKYRNKDNPHKLDIEENSISLITYEGLKNITFNDQSCENELFNDFSKLLSVDFDGSSRENAKNADNIKNVIGISSQVKNTNYVFFEDCGFDNITVDEAHNFKNLWTVPRPKNKGESNEFAGIPSGKPSARALKLFAMTQYTQRHNDDRNVFLLTATPFTNSPLEVYSMLSYVGRKRLIDSGLYSLRDFCNQFAHTKLELGVNSKGEIDQKQVMKDWKELPALQKILTEFIDKVDGEELKEIIRPKKFTHVQELEMCSLQKQMMEIDTQLMNEVKEGNSAAVIVSMNAMRVGLVAPALADPARYPNLKLPSMEKLVETSPKLKFVCDSVIDMYKNHPEKGQFIFMPLGQTAHGIVKDYLIAHGIPKETVEIINGSINNTTEKKDKLTQKFNDPKEKCKILIGGKNTSEGIDLNGNSFAMYNCSLGWNPSETIQAEGRIWRQGNQQGHVHCVYPVMNDSIDSLLYQKHDEKRSRINELWTYKDSDTLNIEDINPEDLKFDLIKDPQKRAKLILENGIDTDDFKFVGTKSIKNELNKVNNRIKSFDEVYEKRINLKKNLEEAEFNIQRIEKNIEDYKNADLETPEWCKAELKDNRKYKTNYEHQLETISRKFASWGIKDEKELEEFIPNLNKQKRTLEAELQAKEKELPKILKMEMLKLNEKKVLLPSISEQRKILTEDIQKKLRPMAEVEPEIRTERFEQMLNLKWERGEISADEAELYSSVGYKNYYAWLDGEIESLGVENIIEKQTEIVQEKTVDISTDKKVEEKQNETNSFSGELFSESELEELTTINEKLNPQLKKHQVIYYYEDSGIDEGLDFMTLLEAQHEGKKSIKEWNLDKTENGFAIFNKETKQIETIHGYFPVEKVFRNEILAINGYKVDESKQEVSLSEIQKSTKEKFAEQGASKEHFDSHVVFATQSKKENTESYGW